MRLICGKDVKRPIIAIGTARDLRYGPQYGEKMPRKP